MAARASNTGRTRFNCPLSTRSSDMKTPCRRRRRLEAVGLALLALAPPTTTMGFAVVGCRRPSTRMVSQAVNAVTPAAENKKRHVRELDPSKPIPKERLFGMPLSRYALGRCGTFFADCCCLLFEKLLAHSCCSNLRYWGDHLDTYTQRQYCTAATRLRWVCVRILRVQSTPTWVPHPSVPVVVRSTRNIAGRRDFWP